MITNEVKLYVYPLTMKYSTLITGILLVAFLSLYAFEFEPAEGWFIAGSKPKSYDMGIDKNAGPDGKNCASIKSKIKKIDGFGTLMQSFNPDEYRGKKIKMTGMMKSADVKSWSGLWLRIDNLESKSILDNMMNRPVKGNTDWKKYEIVLSVPTHARKISFGALLNGTGQIWFDKIEFSAVHDSVPVTNPDPAKPRNLDFDK